MVGLIALKHVTYPTVVRLILEANHGTEITYRDMQLLWDAVVHKCYHFMRVRGGSKPWRVCVYHFLGLS